MVMLYTTEPNFHMDLTNCYFHIAGHLSHFLAFFNVSLLDFLFLCSELYVYLIGFFLECPASFIFKSLFILCMCLNFTVSCLVYICTYPFSSHDTVLCYGPFSYCTTLFLLPCVCFILSHGLSVSVCIFMWCSPFMLLPLHMCVEMLHLCWAVKWILVSWYVHIGLYWKSLLHNIYLVILSLPSSRVLCINRNLRGPLMTNQTFFQHVGCSTTKLQ
jgi:hypothetical protein